MNAPYFPFYPCDWLQDHNVIRLTLEEKGAYIHLLAASWAESATCRLPDDDLFISRRLNIPINKWRRLRKVLIDGKFAVFNSENGQIFNNRLLKEYAIFNEKSKVNTEKINNFWKKKRDKKKLQGANPSNPLKNNDTANTTVLPQYNRSDTITDTDTDTDTDKENIIKEKPLTPKKRATELSPDFKPNTTHIEVAQERQIDLHEEFKRFKARNIAHASKYVNWDAAFTYWLRKSVDYKPTRGNNHEKPLTAVQNFQRLNDESRQREET